MKTSLRLVAGAVMAVASAAALADPLAEFDSLVQRCRAAFEQRPATEVVYTERVGAWVKRQYAPASLAVRVQKTSSPVTPFVAQIEVQQTAAAQSGSDEESVRALEVASDQNVMRSVQRVNLAFQDNAWVAISGVSSVEVRRDASEDFVPAGSKRYSREALQLSQGPIAMCVGQPAWQQTAYRAVP